MLRLYVAITGLALASCGDDAPAGAVEEVKILPAIPNRNLDVLFVIDNSTDMLERQATLAASMPHFIETLATAGLPDLHVGVVTTDMGTTATNGAAGPSVGSGPGSCEGAGDDGVLRNHAPGMSGSFLSDIAASDGTRMRNYTGELGDVLAMLVQNGAAGCGFEQPLHAMRRALENPANDGFLRADANLAIVLLGDEDDCSFSDPALVGSDTDRFGPLQSFRCTRFGVTCDDRGESTDAMNVEGEKTACHGSTDSPVVADVGSFADYLADLKGDTHAVAISAIVGDPSPFVVGLRTSGGGAATPTLLRSCELDEGSGPWVAVPGVRIADLVSRFPGRGEMSSICTADLSMSAERAGRMARQLLGDPCIDVMLVDTSTNPDVQPRCEVVDGPPGAETMIPKCSAGDAGPCWLLVRDTAACAGAPQNLRLEIRRPSPPTTQVYSHLRCQTR